MITSRFLEDNDKGILEQSLLIDNYHKNTTSDFYYESGTIANVYEDEVSPIFVIKGTPAIRLDIQFMDNNDFERNRKALEEAYSPICQQAKAAGFKELIFCSDSPMLRAFCKRKFKFHEVNGELRKLL